jgi:hypothetical protein
MRLAKSGVPFGNRPGIGETSGSDGPALEDTFRSIATSTGNSPYPGGFVFRSVSREHPDKSRCLLQILQQERQTFRTRDSNMSNLLTVAPLELH